MRAGYSPGLIVGLASGVAICIVALGERIMPYRPDWNRPRNDVLTDLLHSLLTSYAFREACKLLFAVAALFVAGVLTQGDRHSLWPASWPFALQVIWAALVAELGQYWAHRLAHENTFFWPWHATHHSPERLYWLNAGRDHPLGVLLQSLGTYFPLLILGCPQEVMLFFVVIEAVHGLFQHGNVDVRFGILNWLFSGPELHRWHHSRVVEEANHNYGATLILWDTVFRTRFFPRSDFVDRVGIHEPRDFPKDFLHQLLVPWTWKQLHRESRKV